MFSTHGSDVSERACRCAHLVSFCPTTVQNVVNDDCGPFAVTLQTHVKMHPTKMRRWPFVSNFYHLDPLEVKLSV